MDFITFYNSITDRYIKRELRKSICEACNAEPSTFYSWKNRNNYPLPVRIKISELLKKSQLELFPENENETISN